MSVARRQRSAYLFLVPWVAGVLVLTIGPMIASLYLSFTDYDLFNPPNWVGLRNYLTMFAHDDRFWHAVRVTVTYVLMSVPAKLLLALGVALLLNRVRRGSGFYRSAFYAPSLLGASVSVALVWRRGFSRGPAAPRARGPCGGPPGGWNNQPA